MGILRMGLAALAVGAAVVAVDHARDPASAEHAAASAPLAGAAGDVLALCRARPELCATVAGAGLAAAGEGFARSRPAPATADVVSTVPVPAAPPRAAPSLRPATVPLPPRRPQT